LGGVATSSYIAYLNITLKHVCISSDVLSPEFIFQVRTGKHILRYNFT